VNSATIRDILTKNASDEEISALAFDHFREVYNQFASGMSRTEKIQRLIEWCERRGELDRLMDVIRHAPILDIGEDPPELLSRLIGAYAILEYLIAYAEAEGGMTAVPPRIRRDVNRYMNLVHQLKLRLLI
jgi:hypothetical protein